MANALTALKQFSTVVADTGDFDQIAQFTPQDATTNPSLLLAASQVAGYANLVTDAVSYGRGQGPEDYPLEHQVQRAADKLAVNFGAKILALIPGRVSTEVDARLSFDTAATVTKAHEIIELYRQAGISSDRILIKIASTWEGLQAARILESEGIHVNMTLIFSVVQAMEAGEAGVTLISPFAGRITDWFKQHDGVTGYAAEDDPGVQSVRQIYRYLKHHNYKTVVMGASFRSAGQVLALAGCDLLTVAPSILKDLEGDHLSVVTRLLDAESSETPFPKTVLDQSSFRLRMNQDEMADFKLAEGIRKFTIDQEKLEANLRARLTTN